MRNQPDHSQTGTQPYAPSFDPAARQPRLCGDGYLVGVQAVKAGLRAFATPRDTLPPPATKL